MAEDIILNAGAGGNTLATDEVSSLTAGLAKMQLVKIAFGPKNSRTLVENSAGASFPVNVVGNINAISATVNAVMGAGVSNIGFINSISATANVIAFGNVAHDAGDSGSPVKIGGKANSSEPAVVADNDRTDAWFDLVGRLVTAPWHPGELSGTATTLSATAQTAIVAAPGASLSLYICSVMGTNKTTTQTRVKLRESAGATGTLKFHADCASSGGGFMWKPLRPWKLPANVALGGSISPAASDVAIVVEFFTAA